MVLKIDNNFSLLLNPSTESSFISEERFDIYGKIGLISYFLFFSVFFQHLYAVHLGNYLVVCCFQQQNGLIIYFYGSNVVSLQCQNTLLQYVLAKF